MVKINLHTKLYFSFCCFRTSWGENIPVFLPLEFDLKYFGSSNVMEYSPPEILKIRNYNCKNIMCNYYFK